MDFQETRIYFKEFIAIYSGAKPPTMAKRSRTPSKWRLFVDTPMKPGWDKANIVSTILLSAFSVVISLVALNQTQEIKGMQELIKGGRPSIGFTNHQLNFESNISRFAVQAKNYGGRKGIGIITKGYFIDTVLKNVQTTKDTTSTFSLSSGENTNIAYTVPFSEEQLKRAYIILVASFKDDLTNTSDTVVDFSHNEASNTGIFVSRRLDEKEIKFLRNLLSEKNIYLPERSR